MNTYLTIKVKLRENEAKVSIPYSERGKIGWSSNEDVGLSVLRITKELIEQLKTVTNDN